MKDTKRRDTYINGKYNCRASLGTSFFQGFYFLKENKLFFFRKIKIPRKNGVPKLAIGEIFYLVEIIY